MTAVTLFLPSARTLDGSPRTPAIVRLDGAHDLSPRTSLCGLR
jgi:hypothetical protein